jgi:hypothetical protein
MNGHGKNVTKRKENQAPGPKRWRHALQNTHWHDSNQFLRGATQLFRHCQLQDAFSLPCELPKNKI